MAQFPRSSQRAQSPFVAIAAALALALTAACGSDPDPDPDPDPDAGSSDAHVDTTTDANADVGDADAIDAGSDADVTDAGDASSPPITPTDLGDACGAVDSCSGEVCFTDWPGGYCSARCERHADCGTGFCMSTYCYQGCPETRTACERTNYFCTFFGWEMGGTAIQACTLGLKLGGTATIPDGVSVVVTDAVGGTLTLSASGAFTFPNRVGFDMPYAVTIATQGNVPGISCRGFGLTGTAYGHVSSVVITCGRQAVFTEPGTYAWVVPPGVNSVSVVAVGSGGRSYDARGGGGGELCYQNDIAVTPGETIQVVVGNLFADAASGHDSSFDGTLVAHGGADAFVGDAWKVPGGTGGTVGTCFAGGYGSYNTSAGGAGGYAGIGGHGFMYLPEEPAENGAGGGGAGGRTGTPGGGVGLEGQGADGIALGGHGSRANDAVPVAGGGGTDYNNAPMTGGHGGVRVIWGAGRSYPTQAANL